MLRSMSWRSVGALALLGAFGAVLSGCGGSSDSPATLKMECSNPRLGVAYDIKYYNGEVSCGNLLLESDIGGGKGPWTPPKITFPSAKEGTYYTLMYIDPYVNVPDDGSCQLGKPCTPGSKAPARHWVVGNIDGSMLKSGDLTGATTVSKFKGPSPPWGSHSYGQFLFQQSGSELIKFESLTSPEGIYNWDYNAFIAKHALGKPLASNFHVTQHMDPSPRLPFNASVPQPPVDPSIPVTPASMMGLLAPFGKCATHKSGVPPLQVTTPVLGVKYDDVEYYDGTVDCGNLLLESDIGGTHTWIPPKITFDEAGRDTLYTLMYIDPECNLANNGSWPDVKTPGSKTPVRHWVVGNIDATMLKTGDLTKATTVSKFKGPSPPWGSHRYGQFLFSQTGHLNFTALPSPTGIYNWDIQKFIDEYKLGTPKASNYHIVQHMPARKPSSAAQYVV